MRSLALLQNEGNFAENMWRTSNLDVYDIPWEVLNGVGVDGVGGFFSFIFLRFSLLFSFFLCFSHILPEDKGKRLQFPGKMGSFTPSPSAPAPFKTSRIRTPTLDGQNRQSPIASVQRTQSTLASHSAVPRGTRTTPTNTNCAIRIAAQRTQGLRGPNSVFLG